MDTRWTIVALDGCSDLPVAHNIDGMTSREMAEAAAVDAFGPAVHHGDHYRSDSVVWYAQSYKVEVR